MYSTEMGERKGKKVGERDREGKREVKKRRKGNGRRNFIGRELSFEPHHNSAAAYCL